MPNCASPMNRSLPPEVRAPAVIAPAAPPAKPATEACDLGGGAIRPQDRRTAAVEKAPRPAVNLPLAEQAAGEAAAIEVGCPNTTSR